MSRGERARARERSKSGLKTAHESTSKTIKKIWRRKKSTHIDHNLGIIN